MNLFLKIGVLAMGATLLLPAAAQEHKQTMNMENLNLTSEWDKTFSKSEKVNHLLHQAKPSRGTLSFSRGLMTADRRLAM